MSGGVDRIEFRQFCFSGVSRRLKIGFVERFFDASSGNPSEWSCGSVIAIGMLVLMFVAAR